MLKFEQIYEQSTAIKIYKGVRTNTDCCGIARSSWPVWRGWAFIDRPEENQDEILNNLILAHYHRNFYSEMRLGEIRSGEIAVDLFDLSVMFGRTIAIRTAQKALNLLADNEITFRIEEDGMVSDYLIKRLNQYVDDRRLQENKLFLTIMILAGDRFKIDPSFFKEWISK